MREEDARQSVCQTDLPAQAAAPSCPVCGGRLIDIRAKLQCSACGRICETCCEGGRG